MLFTGDLRKQIALGILAIILLGTLSVFISTITLEKDEFPRGELKVPSTTISAPKGTRGLQPDCLYYNFEEGHGGTTRDMSLSGNNNGALKGTAAFTNDAKVGGHAMSFPATWGAHVELEDPLNNLHQASAYTFMAWIKVNGGGSGGLVMLGGCCNPRNGYTFATNGNSIRFWGGSDNDNSNYNTYANANVVDNNWHHVAVTCSPTQLKIYIDGNLNVVGTKNVPTTPRTGGNDNRNGPKIMIGGDNVDGQCSQTRIIDEVAVFSRELSQAEIQEAMKGLSSVPATESVKLLDPTEDDGTCFAQYANYTLSANVTTTENLNDVSEIEVFLDYNTTNATLSYNWTEGIFRKEQDMDGHVRLLTENCTIANNGEDKWWVNFSLVFNFTFPHERPVDCYVNTTATSGEYSSDRFPGLFRVENDFEFQGDVYVQGGYQGRIERNDWIRGNENISFTNMSVTYENAPEIYPDDDHFDVKLTDTVGRSWWDNESKGEPIIINITSRNETDEEEAYHITIENIPASGICQTNISYPVKIDAGAPVPPVNLLSHAESFEDRETENTNQQKMFVTWDEVTDNASGLLGYYYSQSDNSGTSNGTFVTYTQVLIEGLAEGYNPIHVWCVDNVGNIGRASSSGILVDLTPPVFSNLLPQDGAWHNQTFVYCSAEILDIEGSGVDGNSIEYTVSTDGVNNFGMWMPAWLSQVEESVEPNILYTFQEGENNFIKWRAKDSSGNGYSESNAVNIKIDTAPIVFGTDITPQENWYTADEITTAIGVSDGGSSVDVDSLEVRISTTGPGGFGDWMKIDAESISKKQDGTYEITVTSIFREGPDNFIMFRGTDLVGNPMSVSDKFNLKIDTTKVYFGDFTPDETSASDDVSVECLIAIFDDGTGVDPATVEYSISTNGPLEDEFGNWKKPPGVITGNPTQVIMEIEFDWGADNYIRWKADDRLGTGYNVSVPYRIWVNSEPYAKISSPVDGEFFLVDQDITFNGSGSGDLDGDGLDFFWTSSIASNRTLGSGSVIGKRLAVGNHTVTLHVSDGNGNNISTSIKVNVGERKGVDIKDDDDSDDDGGEGGGIIAKGAGGNSWLLFMAGAAFVLLLMILMIAILLRRKKKKNTSTTATPPQVYIAPLPSPYPEGQYLPDMPQPYSQEPLPGMNRQPHQLALPPGPQGIPSPGPNSQPLIAQYDAGQQQALPGGTGVVSGQPGGMNYLLPSFSTDEGDQNLNLIALPPGPEVSTVDMQLPGSKTNAPPGPFPEPGFEAPGPMLPGTGPSDGPVMPIPPQTPPVDTTFQELDSFLSEMQGIGNVTPGVETPIDPSSSAPPPIAPPSIASQPIAPPSVAPPPVPPPSAASPPVPPPSAASPPVAPPPAASPPGAPDEPSPEPPSRSINMQCHSCGMNYVAEISDLPAVVTCTHCGT